LLILALQLALPYRTALPVDSALAPRRARPAPETPLPTYSALLQSPIFAPDRSPGGATGDKAGPGSLDQLVVVGIAVGHGAAAAVVKAGEGKSQTLRPGQEIAGWRLVGVDASHLTFIRGGERRILTLDPRKAAGAAGNAADTSQDEDNR
jgi:hypothetical protein